MFGLCLGASNSYTTFLVLTAFVGFGIGGNIPTDTTIALEFIPQVSLATNCLLSAVYLYMTDYLQNRRFLLACLSMFQPIGVVICSAIAYVFIPFHSCSPNFSESNPLPSCRNTKAGVECCMKADNMGWRYLLFSLGAITLSVFILRSLYSLSRNAQVSDLSRARR